ncbi:hypothetical protein [Runella sp.]|uniref:hypothetical protein n=1 Tax=Runella sp. TaxID=1960881 RepID=UPI003D118CC1
MRTDQLSIVRTFFVRARRLESMEGIVLFLLVWAFQARTACQTGVGNNAALCTQTLPLAATSSSRDGLGTPVLWEALGDSHLSLRTYPPDSRCGFDGGLNLLPDFYPIEAYLGLRYSMGERLKRLHLRWGDSPEVRKAFGLELPRRPNSPFKYELMN